MTVKQAYLETADGITDVYEVAEEHKVEKTSHEQAFETIYKQMNGGDQTAYVIVHKVSGDGSSAHVERWDVDKYPDIDQALEHLRTTYGGGDYRFYLRVKGKPGNKANNLYTISEPIVKKDLAVRNGGELGQIVNNLLSRVESLQNMLISKPQVSEQEMEDRMLDRMAKYRELFAGPSTPAKSMVESIKEMLELKMLMSEAGFFPSNPEEKESNQLLEVASGFFNTALPELIKARAAQPQPQPQPQPQSQGQNDMSLQIKIQLGVLLNAAQRDSDPAVYAQLIVDTVGEDAAKRFLSAPDALQKLAEIKPEIADYQEWFIDLAEYVKAIIGEPSKYADQFTFDQDDGITGETDNAPDNESADLRTTVNS